ncbi:hypothetical protein NKK52_25475 [Mesorhizobium sp. C277A]|uniref:hypothetical protein n=1 Tax=Mesorhizobium sp. C277A TaxID=2956827 RepID=UPI001FD8DE52|nr:hypothetical protein [Mesorhizobium sp. LSJC277A00]
MDTRFCRSHADHYARHGSAYKPSYGAREINPYRASALAWLEANQSDTYVANAVDRVATLLRTSGPHIEAFRLRGLSPQERAKAAWARLRKAGVDPRRVVAAWLAVEMIIRDDPQAERKAEFKQVQAAKLIHKMASGTHKRWGEGANVKELHVYPRSRGRILRHVGEALEEACELLVEHRGRDLPERQADRA